MKNYKFEKKNDRWFIVLPEWEGYEDDLEMVMGADTMCDMYAQGETEINITISEEPFKEADTLTRMDPESGGYHYHFTANNIDFPIWLCFVTEHVFGKFPLNIYIK